MITTTLCVSYPEMRDFLHNKEEKFTRLQNLGNNHDRTLVISITNAALSDAWKTPILVTTESESEIALQFDDVEVDFDEENGLYLAKESGLVYFSVPMAQKIVTFIQKAQESHATSDLLVVNCQAGISRSGAVSNFARRVSGMSYDHWRRLCPQANPNSLVSRLLEAEWANLCL